jgi:hypothetical protein
MLKHNQPTSFKQGFRRHNDLAVVFLSLSVLAILLSFMSPRFDHAQTVLATVRGTVTDQQGAAVRQAVVTAREMATNLKRNSTTQRDGQYLLSNLPAGQYEGTVAITGFRTATQPQLKLQVGQHLTLDFSLLLAGTTE